MRPSTWLNAVLERHGLIKADGRPLYRYRLIDSEFNQLTDLLKLSANLGVNNITGMLMWDAAFVMYAAEWWRRYYVGQWGWEGIFDSIGIDPSELSSARRNSLVEVGLQRWGREVRVVGDRRKFLGTVATEGGLPLNQLQNSGAWLTNVLQPALRKHLSKGISISAVVNANEELIPKSYRSSEIKQVLVDIAQTVVELRQNYNLEGRERPLLWLDEHCPSWREQFPLPMDDDQARSLLRDLIDTVVRAKATKETLNPFEVERSLIRVETPTPELVAKIDIPTFVFLESIGIDPATTKWPSLLVLEVYEPGGEAWPWCRAALTNFRGKVALKLSGKPFLLKGEIAAKSLALRIKSDAERVLELSLRGGDALEWGQPWLLSKVDSQWVVRGVASQSVKEKEALVYVPSGSDYSPASEGSELVDCGSLFSGSIVLLTGSMNCYCGEANYALSTGTKDSVVQYQLRGRKCEFSSTPKEVFVGVPVLEEYNLISGRVNELRNARLLARKVGLSEPCRPIALVDYGYFELRYSDDDGNTLLSRRVGILPEGFSVTFKAHKKSVRSGEIWLSGCFGFDLSVSSEGVSCRVERSPSKDTLVLSTDLAPPMTIDVSLQSVTQERSIDFQLPYPSCGSLIFDAFGNLVNRSTPLSLNNLKGWRIKYFDSQFSKGKRLDLVLSLRDSSVKGAGANSVYLKRSVALEGTISEFFISDWQSSIDSLMSVGRSIDALVQVELFYRGEKHVELFVRRYACELTRAEDQFVRLGSSNLRNLSNQDLEGMRVSVLNLTQPEQNVDDLDALTSQGVLCGEWDFNPAGRKEGPWIIYPSLTSSVQFRPALWVIGEPLNAEGVDIHSLAKAMQISNQDDRALAIRAVLNQMAVALDHKSWVFLDSLWSKTKHLPMTTFDIWRLCISESAFLASLFVNGKSDFVDLIDRLEAELPVIWELVKISDWQLALCRYQSRIIEALNDEELAYDLIKKKIDDISHICPSMIGVGHILQAKMFEEECPEYKALGRPAAHFLAPALKAEQQSLLINHADDSWPEFLSSTIFYRMKELPQSYRSLVKVQHGHQTPVTYLPWVLAWQIANLDQNDWPSSAEDIFQIQQLIRFDEEWFSKVYQYLSCWLSQQTMELM